MDNENKVQEENTTSENKSFFAKVGGFFVTVGKTLWRWIKRTFMGSSKTELANANVFDVEAIESPLKLAVQSFKRNKLAVVALVVFLVMFLYMFIAPLFIQYDLTYQDVSQKNIAPNFSMMSVPGEVANDCVSISSYASFSVGLSGKGNVFVWGNSTLGASGVNIKDIPQEVKDANIKFAAAGNDHIIAIDDKGKVYGWGLGDNGQFGENSEMPAQVDVNKVVKLVCGYQISAIVMQDGEMYLWGNARTINNLEEMKECTNVKDVQFTGTQVVVLYKDGTFYAGRYNPFTSVNGAYGTSLDEYLAKHTIEAIATTSSTCAFLLENGEIITSGNFNYNENKVPELASGEKFVSVASGTRHYVAISDTGKVYAWGANNLHQCDIQNGADGADKVFAGALQSYAIKDGRVVAKWGHKGYLMGTDEFGRDVYARLIHGGKMTMTVGAVAVIVSTIIAIIVGCISGYFGGWVDMLLMRITEIFSAIPFLPFAMLLSLVMMTSPLGETERILIMMVILGLLSWTGLAHMIRGQVLAEREKEFVLAAKAMGVKETRIAFKHILPNVVSVILVSVTLDFAGCMLTESSLSYLGFGVQPPNPTWGNMLTGSNNSIVIKDYWWRWFFPSLFLGIATICINIIGDTLRDVLDPKSSAEK